MTSLPGLLPRTPLSLGLLWLCAQCVGCSSTDRSCAEKHDDLSLDDTAQYRSSVITGTSTLPAASTETLAFEVELSHLPEVWLARDTVVDPSFVVTVTLSYGSDTPPNSELPELALRLSNGYRWATAESSPQATIGGFTASGSVSIQPFRTCESEGQKECCFAASSCSSTVELELSRSDTFFPTIFASWEVNASASVYACLAGEDTPLLEVSELE
jgi:hypothetical protein